ncbi:MAG: phosphopantothenoylcysteine decarboxylase domain-containing protein [Arsenophonus sp. NEOnobi-MAG3]
MGEQEKIDPIRFLTNHSSGKNSFCNSSSGWRAKC